MLHISELEKLEKEFVDFLVVNGITVEDWAKIKNDSTRAQGILEAFSDVIWEGVLKGTQYLVRAQGRSLFCFHFGEEKASLLIVTATHQVESYEDWKLVDRDVTYVFQEKRYQGERNMEIFALIQQGAQISAGEHYRLWMDQRSGRDN